MEQIDVNQVIGDKRTSYKGVWKHGVAHCVVINPNQLINIQLIILDFFSSSAHLAKGSEVEAAVVVVTDCVLLPIPWLLDLF